MKKLLLIILLLPFITKGQQVYLGCTKSMIKSDMEVYEGFKQTVEAKDYYEYQKDSLAVGYRFKHGVCVSSLITMSKEEGKKFIAERTVKLWKPYLHGWLYNTKIFDTPIFIQKFEDDNTITFEYTFLDEEIELLNTENDG